MKRVNKNLNKDLQLETQGRSFHTLSFNEDEEIDKTTIYWLSYAYSSPFMPMMDLSFVFDEIIKIVKNWFNKKHH